MMLGIALLLTFFVVSCGKKSDPTPPASSTQATVSTEPLAPANPAANAANSQPQGNVSANEAEAALGALTQAVRKYSAEKQKVPQSLDEVIAAGYVNLPPAPAGKRYAINPKRLEVELVNK